MPKLEELFYIPKPSVYLGMDFTKAENSAEGTVGVSLRVCDLFAILFTLAVPVGKWFLRWRRAHGGEAKAEPPAERVAAPETNEPENGLHRKEDQDGEQGKELGKRADGDYDDEDPRNGGFQFRHR